MPMRRPQISLAICLLMASTLGSSTEKTPIHNRPQSIDDVIFVPPGNIQEDLRIGGRLEEYEIYIMEKIIPRLEPNTCRQVTCGIVGGINALMIIAFIVYFMRHSHDLIGD